MEIQKQKTRIALTPSPELDAVLVRLARLQKKSKTTVIDEWLTEILPVMEGVATSLELIEANKDPSKYLNRMAADAMIKMGQMGKELDGINQKIDDNLELPL
jgi:hypothetical protein